MPDLTSFRHTSSRFVLGLLAACCLICLSIGVSTAAELSCTQTTVTFTAAIEADGQDVTFDFRNAGSEPITITDVQTGCGCVTSRLEKRLYAPGESGQLHLHVDFQNRTGPIKKRVHVKQRSGTETKETDQLLMIDGIALTPIVLDHLTVSWAVGDPISTKDIVVTVKAGYQVNDLAVETDTPSEHVKVETVAAPNGGLRVRVTPQFTDGQTTVSLVNGREMQQAYFLTYTYLPSGIKKKERFYALIYR